MGWAVLIIVILVLAALAGNIDLIILLCGGTLPEKQELLIFIAVIADIALVFLIIKKLSENYEQNQNIKIQDRRRRLKAKIKEFDYKYDGIIDLVTKYQKSAEQNIKFIELIMRLNSNSINNPFSSYIQESETIIYNQIKDKIAEFDIELSKLDKKEFFKYLDDLKRKKKFIDNEKNHIDSMLKYELNEFESYLK